MTLKWIAAAAIAVGGAWTAWLGQEFIFQWFDIPWKSEMLGQLGDTFGALNALFSALAFVAVLYTLKQQKDDVSRQLKQQRADLARQQKQIRSAERDQHLQRFERTFYELLRLLREARDDVEFRYSSDYLRDGGPTDRDASDRVDGTEAFKRANFELRHWASRAHRQAGSVSSEELAEIYMKYVHRRYESTFAPYYRLLYTLLLRIHEDEVLIDIQKHRYGNLLRSQLTSHEVAMCCYNGLAAVSGRFKELIVEYRLLKYLPDEFGRKRLQLHYPASAFLGRDDTTPALDGSSDEASVDNVSAEVGTVLASGVP